MGEVQLADGETIKTSPDVVQITPVVRGFALTLSVVAILIALSFGIWTAVHKNSRVVRASQPVFLQLIVLGVVVFTSGAIPTASIDFVSASNEAAAAVCTAHLWLLALGTGITLGAMQAKLYRINKIVQSATKFKRIKVTAGDAIKPTIAITSVIAIILGCMSSIDPIGFVWYQQFNSEGNVSRIWGSCDYSDSVAYLSAAGALLLTLLIMLCIQAWKARNISTEFSESKDIFKILVIFDIAVFLGWPILYLSQDTPNVLIIMSASINFIISCTTTLIMFVPKVISHLKHGDEGPALRPIRLTGISNQESRENAAATALDRLSNGEGEAVLTTKAPTELLDVIYRLQYEVRELRQENARLLKRIPLNEQDTTKVGTNGTILEEESPGIESDCVSTSMETVEGHTADSC